MENLITPPKAHSVNGQYGVSLPTHGVSGRWNQKSICTVFTVFDNILKNEGSFNDYRHLLNLPL